MARFSRTRISRTVVSAVVIAIAIGAAFQFHRVRNSTAITPPLQMSVSNNGGAITLAPAAKPPAIAPISTAINPLVSQTPDSNKSPVVAAQAKAINRHSLPKTHR